MSVDQLLQPVLATGLPKVYGEQAGLVHESMARLSLDTLIQRMPDLQHSTDSPTTGVAYALLTPESGDYDLTQTVVSVSAGAREWSPANYIGSETLRRMVAPDGAMIVLPHNNNGQQNYSFSKEERALIASGDQSPLTNRQLHLLTNVLKLPGVNLFAGRSGGAINGAALSSAAYGRLATGAHLFDEPPAPREELPLGLRKVLSPRVARGLQLRLAMAYEKSFVKESIRAAALPSLDQANHVDDSRAFALETLRFTLGGNLEPANRAINIGFTQNRFLEYLSMVISIDGWDGLRASTALVSNAIGSRVSNDAENDLDLLDGVGIVTEGLESPILHVSYEGTHSTGGNPFVMGVLGLLAIEFQASKDRSDPDQSWS